MAKNQRSKLTFVIIFEGTVFCLNSVGNFFLVLDYVFAHYCAVTATTTVIFIAYCIAKRNNPHISAELVSLHSDSNPVDLLFICFFSREIGFLFQILLAYARGVAEFLNA